MNASGDRSSPEAEQARQWRALLAVVLLTGLALRLWGSFADLPLVFHSDEPLNISIVQRIFKTGNLNPGFFQYPSFFFYLHALAYVPYFLAGRLTGAFGSISDVTAPVSLVMGTALTALPSAVVLGRVVSICVGVGCIALVYAIGTAAGQGRPIALFAAVLTAVSPTLVSESRAVTPDILVTFWTLAACLTSMYVVSRGSWRDYALTGLAAGLAASSKYNGGVSLAILVAAHLVRSVRPGPPFAGRRLALGLAAAAAAFLATTPFAAIDSVTFLKDLSFEASHYAGGHPGMEGDSLRWYALYLWRTEGLVAAAAAIQTVRAFLSRSPQTTVVATFATVYVVAIGLHEVRNERTILPAIPFLHVLAAYLVADLLRSRERWRSGAARGVALAGCVALVTLAVARPVRVSAREAKSLTTIDGRTTARTWINEHVAPGSTIALEAYSPFLAPDRFDLRPVIKITDHAPEWYVQQKVDYLVFSQGMFGRFYRQPDRYAAEIAEYEHLFHRFPLVRSFVDGGYDVRLYRVSAP